VKSVVELVRISQGSGGKNEMRKVKKRETRSRIDQGVFNHEGRKMTRRGEGKDEMGKVENRETESAR
jgi:hypothetical protein